MKRLSILASLFLTSQVQAGVLPSWQIPSGYSELETSNGATLYRSDNARFDVVYVNLAKADLIFDNVEYSGSNNQKGHKMYNRMSQDVFWNTFSTQGLTFAMINGQFFSNDNSSQYKTLISYPLQGNYNTIQSHIDDNKDIKTLFKKNGSYHLKSTYDSNDLQYTSDYFVGWNHLKNANMNIRDNYTHIGTIPVDSNCQSEINTCKIKGLVFIITKKHYSLSGPVELKQKWNIDYDNIIRLDSGGSTQYKTKENEFWELYPNESHKRSLPHMLEVRDKYTCVPGNSNC